MNALEIKSLTKTYPGFCLDNITFSLPFGTILGLVGENGAGKSTIINLIMNTIKADSGSVSVLGVENTDKRFTDLKNDIGVVLDEAYFPEELNAKNVNSILKHTYRNWEEKAFDTYLQKFSLPSDKAFKAFSKGMKMKLAIAAALSHDPKILILDEATGGLDPMVRDEILDIFNDYTKDKNHSVLISSHIVSDLEKVCDSIAFVHKGKLVLCDQKEHLTRQYAIIKVDENTLKSLPPHAVKGIKETKNGREALVERNAIGANIPTEHTGLEDIILFLAKGEEQA